MPGKAAKDHYKGRLTADLNQFQLPLRLQQQLRVLPTLMRKPTLLKIIESSPLLELLLLKGISKRRRIA
jgi:hypothetical protein